MKIRAGFVSNSSSSSFVIHRSYISKDVLNEFENLYNKMVESEEIYDEAGENFEISENYVSWNAYGGADELLEFLKSKGIDKNKIHTIYG